MKKFKVTYKPLKQSVFIVDAETPSQAVARADIERKKQFELLSTDVSTVEYKEQSKSQEN